MPGELRILAVRLSSMGDIIHSLPAVASLKQSLPAAQVTWMLKPHWAPLLEGNSHIDAILPFDRWTARGRVETWRRLRSGRFDLAIDFQGLVQSALLARLSGARRVVGFERPHLRERAAALFYTERIETRSRHVVDQNLDLAAACGATSGNVIFPLPPGAPEGELPPGPFVLASPVAGWPAKEWPDEYYGQLAALLDEEAGLPLVVNGAREQAERLRKIPGVAVHVSGIAGLIDATRRAAAVAGIDSGPLHLAAALGKPGVAILGPTDPARNGPYGGSLRVLRDPMAVTSYSRRREIDRSMRHITPRMVFDALVS